MAYFHSKITFPTPADLTAAPADVLLDEMWYNVSDAGNGHPASYQYQVANSEALVTGVVLAVTNGPGRFKIFGGAPADIPPQVATVTGGAGDPTASPPTSDPALGVVDIHVQSSPARVWFSLPGLTGGVNGWGYADLTTSLPLLPNLSITALSFFGGDVNSGIDIELTLNNTGTAAMPATYSLTLAYYLALASYSSQAEIEANGLLLGTQVITQTEWPGVVGTNYGNLVGFTTAQFDSADPIWSAGTRFLHVVLDSAGVIAESDENNVFSVEFTLS